MPHGAVSSAWPPRLWVLTSPHAGDNTQLLALARALGIPFEVKRFRYRPWQTPARLMLGATRAGVDMRASSPLDPPWPDLIIGAGFRMEDLRTCYAPGPKPFTFLYEGRAKGA